MIALSTWLLTPLYRLRGRWLRRHMRRQAGGYTDPPRQPPTAPAPRIIVVTAPPARTIVVNFGDGRIVELDQDRIAYLALMRRAEQEEPTT